MFASKQTNYSDSDSRKLGFKTSEPVKFMRIDHRELFWEPKEDIATYELALCLPILFGIGHPLQRFDQLPEAARRHFRVQ